MKLDQVPRFILAGASSLLLAGSLQAASQSLIPAGSSWRYLDNGTDPGMSWPTAEFDDSGWAMGVAQLGYGDGDEQTVLGFGPDANNKFITSYFRKSFILADAGSVRSLQLKLLRDDGAVVYLNGVEVHRSNMPGGSITGATTASSAVGGADESRFYSAELDAALLAEGSNTLAVEVHQSGGSSSDLSFDLELLASDTAPVIFVPVGSEWAYQDDGSDQGTSWTAASFDDSSWKRGSAELGYGDGDEQTIVSFGSNAGNKHITTYFRRYFEVQDPSAVTALNLQLLRDDGAIVYLNGVEAFRSNMPGGAVDYRTLASVALGTPEESTFVRGSIDAGLLVPGANILAVELHQSDGASSDLSFNLELAGSDSVSVLRGPYLQMGTPTSVIVRWRTDALTDSVVRYGTTADTLDQMVAQSERTSEHEVTLAGLAPNTRYFYSVGTSEAPLASGADYMFFTSPEPGSAQAMRIWVLGDSGTADANAAAVRNAYYSFAANRYTDLLLMLGDNAYPNGTDSEYQAAVFDMYPSILRSTVVWPTIGNHDTAGASSVPADLPYFSMFTLPTNGEAGGLPSGTEKYYSFNFGNIHFICLDSMVSDRSVSGPMLTWLESDLANNSLPWVIAFWHHPPFSKGSHDSDSEIQLIEMRQNALPILDRYNVDLVLSGHSHAYERSYLIEGHYGKSTTFDASMMVDGGSGRADGSGEYLKPVGDRTAREGAVYVVAGSSGKISGGDLNHPVMYLSLNRLGSLVLDVDGNRMDVKFLTETGETADYFSMIKGDASNLPPSVGVLAPLSGSIYVEPATITLSAEALDSDGTVTRVDFYANESWIDGDITAPFEVVWSGVPPGEYTIHAIATDDQNALGRSEDVLVTVQPSSPPAAPTGLVASPLSSSQIELAWTDQSETESAFFVQRSADRQAWEMAAELDANSSVWEDTGLTASTTYFYRVIAVNVAGESAPSGVASATTLGVPPLAPDSLVAEATSADAIRLTWSDNSLDEAAFVMERALEGGDWAGVELPADTTEYIDSGLQAETTYQYRVAARNANGDSPFTSIATAQTLEPLVSDSVPSGEVAVAGTVSGTFLDLQTSDARQQAITEVESGGKPQSRYSFLEHKWLIVTQEGNAKRLFIDAWSSVSADGDRFVLEWSADDQTYFPLLEIGKTSSGGGYQEAEMPASLTGAVYLRVKDTDRKAGNRVLDTVWVEHLFIRSDRSPTGLVPVGPSDFTALAQSTSAIELAWSDNSTDETGFRLERALSGEAVFEPVAVLSPNAEGYVDSGLTADTAYSYRLVAFNDVGDSTAAEISSSTLPLPPSAPEGLSAAGGDGSVSLSWNSVSGADYYFVKRSTFSGSGYAEIAGPINATGWNDSTVSNGLTYYYVVVARNEAGDSAPSNEASATPFGPPPPPAGLTATAVSKTRVDLGWNDTAANEDGFIIERSSDGVQFAEIGRLGANTGSFADSTVSGGRTYYYRVRAFNSLGASAVSNVATVRTPRK